MLKNARCIQYTQIKNIHSLLTNAVHCNVTILFIFFSSEMHFHFNCRFNLFSKFHGQHKLFLSTISFGIFIIIFFRCAWCDFFIFHKYFRMRQRKNILYCSVYNKKISIKINFQLQYDVEWQIVITAKNAS